MKLLIFLGLMLVTQNVFANQFKVMVYPLSKEYFVEKGAKEFEIKIKVQNLTKGKRKGFLKFDDKFKNEPEISLLPYLVYEEEMIELEPEAHKIIVAKFKLPKGFEGTKYLKYFFLDKTASGQLNIQLQAGAMIGLSVNGTKKYKVKLAKTEDQIKDGVNYYKIEIDNKSNTFIKNLKIQAFIFDAKNKLIDKVIINRLEKSFIHQGEKEFFIVKSKKIKKGVKYKAKILVTNEKSDFFIEENLDLN